MRLTYIAAIVCAFVVDAADAASDEGSTALPTGYGEDLKATPTPDADKVIWVLGMVRNQKAIPPVKGLTVSKVIEMAGGFADFANRSKVRVSRRKENRSFTVDVKAVLQKKPDAHDPLLEAGDLVYVATLVVD